MTGTLLARMVLSSHHPADQWMWKNRVGFLCWSRLADLSAWFAAAAFALLTDPHLEESDQIQSFMKIQSSEQT